MQPITEQMKLEQAETTLREATSRADKADNAFDFARMEATDAAVLEDIAQAAVKRLRQSSSTKGDNT